MKKTLLLAGAVAAFALLNLHAGNTESSKAPDATASTNKTSASCPMGGAGTGGAGCATGATCSKGDKASASCPKSASKAKASGSCPVAKDGARTCPVTGAAGKTDKPADASEKPADKDAR